MSFGHWAKGGPKRAARGGERGDHRAARARAGRRGGRHDSAADSGGRGDSGRQPARREERHIARPAAAGGGGAAGRGARAVRACSRRSSCRAMRSCRSRRCRTCWSKPGRRMRFSSPGEVHDDARSASRSSTDYGLRVGAVRFADEVRLDQLGSIGAAGRGRSRRRRRRLRAKRVQPVVTYLANTIVVGSGDAETEDSVFDDHGRRFDRGHWAAAG